MLCNRPKRNTVLGALVGMLFFLGVASTAHAIDLPVVNGQTVAWNAENVQSQLDLSNAELKSVAEARNQAYRNNQTVASQNYDYRYNQIRKDITELESMQRSFDLISRGQNGQLTAADLPALNAADKDMVARTEGAIKGREGALRSEMYGSILADLRAQKAALQNNDAIRDRLTKEAAAHRAAINSGNATTRDEKTNAAQDAADKKAPGIGIDCKFSLVGKSFDPRACLVVWGAAVSDLGLHFTTRILGLVEVLFNATITFTIVEFSKFVDQPFVKEVWGQIRNLANVIMLFILLYAAIGLVLQLRSVESKRIVANVIFAALLINFSFFLTKEAIRVSNIVTVALYKKAALVPNGSGVNTKQEYNLSKKLTQNFTPKTNPQTGAPNDDINKNLTTTNIWDRILGIIFEKAGQLVVLLITTVVLIAAMIALIKRFVVLVFVVIFSPIPFISGSVPKLKEVGQTWTSALMKQVIFAPAYFLALWLAVEVITSIGTVTGNIAGVSAADASISADALINALIINAFMIGALLVGNALGDKGSAGAVGMLKGWGNRAKGFAAGGAAGWAGRNVLGRFGKAATESEALRERASQKGVGGWFARQRLKVYDKAAKSSFDIRNTEAGKAVGISKWGTAAKKGGYDKALKDSIDKEKKFAADLIGPDKVAGKAASEAKTAAETERDEVVTKVKEAKIKVSGISQELKEHEAKIVSEKAKLPKGMAPKDPAAEERVRRMETEELKAIQDKLAAAKKEEDTAKTEQKAAQEKIKTAEADAEDARKRRQNTYADAVAAMPFWGRKRKKQAEAIREQAKKSKKDRDREKILGLLDEKEKGDGGEKDKDKDKGGGSEEKPKTT